MYNLFLKIVLKRIGSKHRLRIHAHLKYPARGYFQIHICAQGIIHDIQLFLNKRVHQNQTHFDPSLPSGHQNIADGSSCVNYNIYII